MSVRIIITGHEIIGDHTEYIIQISCSGVHWFISRRFSDFDQLHSRLKNEYQNQLQNIHLPEKQWFGRFDSNFILKREKKLEIYLDRLLQITDILKNKIIQHFLEIDKNLELSENLTFHYCPNEMINVNNTNNTNGSNKNSSITDELGHSTTLYNKNGSTCTLTENERLADIVNIMGRSLVDVSQSPNHLYDPEILQMRQNDCYQLINNNNQIHTQYQKIKKIENKNIINKHLPYTILPNTSAHTTSSFNTIIESIIHSNDTIIENVPKLKLVYNKNKNLIQDIYTFKQPKDPLVIQFNNNNDQIKAN